MRSNDTKIYSKSVVLVGLMGSGKSSAGVELAGLTGLPFADSDLEIELRTHHTISELFAKHGEQEFRKSEKDIMRELLSGEPKIIASGGGGFIQNEIRNLIKNTAFSVWLKTDINVILQRISKQKHRPLLNTGKPEERLKELMDARYPIYAEADITVETGGQTPHDIAMRIKTEVDRHAGKKLSAGT